jgi:fatty acid kinase fatty acid binding subunit
MSTPPTVAIIVDSAAAMPPAVAASYDITVVPLSITVQGTTYADGELTDDDLLTRLDEGVTTSAPAPGDFLRAIEGALAQADTAVVVTVAQSLSASYGSAHIAVGSHADRVRLVDSESAAGAEVLVALAAAEAARGGGSLDEVEQAALAAVPEVRLVGTLDSLEHLVRSGRVPGLAGAAGRMLGVNPLFELRRGKVRPLRPAFSREAAFDRVLEMWLRSRGEATRSSVVALHAMAPDAAKKLRERVLEQAAPDPLLLSAFGAAMIAHAGPGVAGLAWRWHGVQS